MAFITGEQAGAIAGVLREHADAMAAALRRQAEDDPVLAEEITSIGESYPFLVRMATAAEQIRCECCGTWVTMVDEAEAGQPRTWKPGIWEAGVWRKHTLRRCNWMRDHAA